ncbi:MAG: hypothetical protein JKY61_12005 [Planctomycetes bacterium]|nr:hypothetical protein [Planctomycetota bacterium]
MKTLILTLPLLVAVGLSSCNRSSSSGGSGATAPGGTTQIEGNGPAGPAIGINQAPVLNWIDNPAVNEGGSLVVKLSASDWNAGDLLTFSVEPILPFAQLLDNGDGTAALTMDPVVGDAGVWPVFITVTDDGSPALSVTKKVTLSIADASDVLVEGVVLDEVSGMPVFFAPVLIQGTDFQTVTGVDGRFGLYLAPGMNQTVAVGKKGYYNASVQANASSFDLKIEMKPVSFGTNEAYSFLDPLSCGGCHPDQLMQWEGSAMAKAGLNTWVHDIYAGNGTAGGMGGFVYTRDSVFAGSNPDSECASCHQPEPYINAGFAGRMESPVDAGYPSIGTNHGISCEVCHKIANVDVAKINFPGVFPGAVTMNLPDGADQIMYGAYPDSDYHIATVMEPAYQPQLMAEVCGVCHQDKNDIHEDLTFAGVTSEPTYTEWAESDYGDPDSPSFQTCVDCHMPATGAPNGCSVIVLDRGPDAVRSHDIKGTTAEYLDNAVELTMQTVRVGNELQIQVGINNSLTGHHVPTGVTIRNMILVVEAWVDGNDPNTDLLDFTGTQLVHDLGGVGNPAQGYYAGRPGKYFGKVNHDANGQGPTFFTDATGITFDSRIPANTTDSTSYTFDVPASGSGTIQVRARLIYRRSFRVLTDAKGWTQDGHGNPLEDVIAPHYGHLMEQATESLGF